MTHFWKEHEQQSTEGASIWLWGKYLAPVVLDLLETIRLLWRQICIPAFKAFGHLLALVVKTCFFICFGSMGKTRTAQSDLEKKLAAIEARESSNTHRLSNQTTMQLRKIQGAIGDNWASAAHQPFHSHRGKAERWASSQRKHTRTVVTNPWLSAAAAPPGRAPSSNAPTLHEDIMGLDELFDRPMSGLLTDQPLPSAEPYSQPTKQARKKLTHVSFDTMPKAAGAKQRPIEQSHTAACECGRPIAKTEMVHATGISHPVMAMTDFSTGDSLTPTEPPGISLYAETPSSDKPSMPEPGGEDAYTGETTSSYDVFESDEPYFNSFDTLPNYEPWNGTPLKADPGVPTSTHSSHNFRDEQEDLPIVQAVPPMQNDYPAMTSPSLMDAAPAEYSPKNVPWFAQECDNPLTALTNAPASNVPWSAPESAPEPPAKPIQPTPKPAPIVRPLEKKALPPTPKPLPMAKPEPLRLDHELEDDLNGFDYMLQNNRILSNSISNLVDSYFRNASLEEDPKLY